MKKIGIIYHPSLQAAKKLAEELAKTIRSSNCQAWLYPASEGDKATAQLEGTDLVLTVGGDGTILRAAWLVVPRPIPIVGINLGRLGFMTELTAEEVKEKLPAFIKGDGWLDQRTMLQADLIPGGAAGKTSTRQTFHALNDVVLSKGASANIVYIRAMINGELLTTYRGDGVIVATATGSTAYALAAGGPILYPQATDFVLQPIVSHLSLSSALVLPASTRLELEVDTDHQAVLSVDGRVNLPLNTGDRVEVRDSPYRLRFLRGQPSSSFYSMLKKRLIDRQANSWDPK